MWEVREGHDLDHFMERMVSDPDIRKVVMVCDERYVEKANRRTGGVGTETQIISREVYENQQQEKFVALILATSPEGGRALIPAYYASKVYIDFRDTSLYAESFEKLLRWCYDKPLRIKPALGSRPAFLSEDPQASLGTTASYIRALDAIRNHRPYAAGSLDEYYNTFVKNLEIFRIKDPSGEIDDAIVKSLSDLKPYRDQCVRIFCAVAQYMPSQDFVISTHRFLEQLIKYMHRTEEVSMWNEVNFENFRFLAHELALCVLAALLHNDRFDEAELLLSRPFQLPPHISVDRINRPDSFVSVFRVHLHSLEKRNNRLQSNRASLHADMLKERSAASELSFEYIMQADFLCFLRYEIESGDNYHGWWPSTLVYSHNRNRPFEIFARAASRKYFLRIRNLLEVSEPRDLTPLFDEFLSGKRDVPRWSYFRLDVASLANYRNLATRP